MTRSATRFNAAQRSDVDGAGSGRRDPYASTRVDRPTAYEQRQRRRRGRSTDSDEGGVDPVPEREVDVVGLGVERRDGRVDERIEHAGTHAEHDVTTAASTSAGPGERRPTDAVRRRDGDATATRRLRPEHAPHEASAVGDGERRAGDGDGERHGPADRDPAVDRSASSTASLATKPSDERDAGHRRGADRPRPRRPRPHDRSRRGIRRRSRVPNWWSRMPTTMNVGGLEARRGRAAAPHRPPSPPAVPMPNTATMKPSWLTVPKASSSLRSYWRRARSPPATIVTRPTPITTGRHQSTSTANAGDRRATRYTPAFTIVAEWRYALTGVGATIAPGSHEWNGYCADLVNAPSEDEHQRRRSPACPSGGSARSALSWYVPAACADEDEPGEHRQRAGAGDEQRLQRGGRALGRRCGRCRSAGTR